MNVSEFVKGTLVYLANCFFVFLLLLLNFWKPNASVERLLIRRAEQADRWPDGRVILLLSILFYQLTTYEALVDDKGPILVSGNLLFGQSVLPHVAIIATVLGYIVFEGTMLLFPWDKPDDPDAIRPNERIRYLLALIIVISAIWLWLIILGGNQVRSWISQSSSPDSTQLNILSAFLSILVALPFVLSAYIISKNPFLLPKKWSYIYPFALFFVFAFAPLVAFQLTNSFAPVVQPRLTQVACKINADGSGEMSALVINDSDIAWRLTTHDLSLHFISPADLGAAAIQTASDGDIKFELPVPIEGAIYVTPRTHTSIRLAFKTVDPSRFISPPFACLLSNRFGPDNGAPLPPPITDPLQWTRTTGDYGTVGSVEIVQPVLTAPPPPPPE